MALEPASARLAGSPGESLAYTLRVTNTGPETADYELSASGYQWPTEIEPALLSLEPGQSSDVLVTVRIPEDASPGDFDLAEIGAFYVRDHAVHAGAVLETWVRVYRLGLNSPQPEKRGRPGQTISFPIQVTNAGNVQDSVDLEIASPGGWPALPLNSPLELAAGETKEVMVTVIIPPGAADGTQEALTLIAKSRGDPSVSARLELRVIVAYPKLFLPLVMSR